jgi:glc operon protein GlcG
MAHVMRNQPKLTIEGARAVMAAAQKRAVEIKCPMNIAVVDDGGHLLLFERMDGAKPSSIRIAQVKAQSAALRRAPTRPSMTATPSGDQPNVVLAVTLAVAAPDEQTPIRGGLPLIADGQVVGAIGVSAGSEDQDVDVAQAGAAVLEKA